MNYEFTKDCEIMNCEFLEGEIVDAKAVQFYPTVMKQTDEDTTHTVAKTGDTLIKTEVVKTKKADSKEGEAKKGEKKDSKKADSKEGEAKSE